MNVRIAVLRNQQEISLRCIAGEYLIGWKDGSEPLYPGEERKFSTVRQTEAVWCKRTRLSDQPIENGLQTGVVSQTESGAVHSRRWLQLENCEQITSSDPLYTQATAIAHSEAHDGQLYYRDERPHTDPTVVMGWRPISAPIVLQPVSPDSELQIDQVRVGIGFHWDGKQNLRYRGKIELHLLADGLAAIVETPIEEYLATVNSSEMPADMHLEFLKAQTVAARSWLLANLGTHHPGSPFDVCSDDHCQCYHGAIKLKPSSVQAAQETAGEVLVCSDESGVRRITDARYAKTCGGRFEPGAAVWGGETPGLVYSDDRSDGSSAPPITTEAEAEILGEMGESDFCNPLLYPYPPSLQYCEPYYRWVKQYRHEECAGYLKRSTGVDIGTIVSMEVIQRGVSGRIHILRINGSQQQIEITGELAIRRALSDTHLPSSAFVVDITTDYVILRGGGWGHGAGLCQTGAAVRATQGESYRDILSVYYPTSKIERLIQVER